MVIDHNGDVSMNGSLNVNGNIKAFGGNYEFRSPNDTNATFTIASGNEANLTTLYLATQEKTSSTHARKVAIIDDALNNWSRANLHFCLNNTKMKNQSVEMLQFRNKLFNLFVKFCVCLIARIYIVPLP